MIRKILINALDTEECRIAIVENSKLEGFHIESATREITKGNIYKGVIARIEPGLQAAFVDYGAERHGFLQKHEIHSDYFQDGQPGEHNLKHLLKRGQELLVQVTKEPIMNKGGMLTTYISLPGRYVVLMPGSKNVGISRKIEEEKERTPLRGIIDGLKLAEGYGVIVRTAGRDCTKTRITKDLSYLMRLWKNIKKKGLRQSKPGILYKERSLAVRFIRDYFTPDVTEILIDNTDVCQEVKDFVQIISPKHTKIVRLYQGARPIFTKHQLEEQIASVFESRVTLKSGGTIVIEQTEAMVSIDVNSGKGMHKSSIEKTALMANVEATEELARQLRLRDLGGLIVVDFIDMKDPKHKAEVERALKKHVRVDRARTRVGRISRFGLLEMSRQRMSPSISFGSMVPCPHCQGKAFIPSIETLALGFLRRLRLETLKGEVSVITGVVPLQVADYIVNKKRRELLDMEERRDLQIVIKGSKELVPGESQIECY
ncbi:Ribonuclease E (EC [Olavius algarvensis associated proteobacterium Delta 3]|nr:Ribonuclease E (EC [Olavius algarvensis associated proteobacterium Delta 3]